MKPKFSRQGAKPQREDAKGEWRSTPLRPQRLDVRFMSLAVFTAHVFRARWTLTRLLVLTLVAFCLGIAIINPHRASAESGEQAKNKKDERAALIEAALFTRTEFFGAQALVPYPTAEARNRLADLLGKNPDEPQIYLKLSQLDERLGRVEQAEKEMQRYVGLRHGSPEALEELAAFLHTRAQFSKEAAVLERMITVIPSHERTRVLQRLIELARVHKLENYLKPEFYEQIIAQDPSVFEIIDQYIQRLTEEQSYQQALKVLRQHKPSFPDRTNYLMEKEVSLLVTLGKEREAEEVYREAFDPFWPDELSGNFYSFLSDHERLRAYGHELREAFRRNPADFAVAVRLHHYLQQSGESSPAIFVRLEKARAARGIGWKPEELATIARLLIADGDGDTASRFLYTLYLQGGMKPGSEVRAKVLYQLFELLADAKDERIALTRGDLKFYQDIATADPHPGILGGVLSLIFSDTDPPAELEREEEAAVKHFNRAAAYRVFTAYKQEYPTSPELAQMYLDIVRLYTATKEPEIAAEALAEFEQRYGDAPQYAEVALKLADCYITLGKHEAERALYQRVMDQLGKKRRSGSALVPSSQSAFGDAAQSETLNFFSEPTEVKPSPISYPPASNPGINIPDENGAATEADYYYYRRPSQYHDYMPAPHKGPASSAKQQASSVDYSTVLERYVASLARENRTAEILALYSGEIKKYPDEQGLYERMLQWLGQTNLVEEQLRVYKETLRKFPSTVWRDRLARWFLRNKRQQEFEAFSRELLEKLNDQEIEAYLTRFIESSAYASLSSFDANLYLGLYSLAHERFPHNLHFVQGLLRFYSAHEQWPPWRNLMAEYYFESREIRDQFLSHLASHRELRDYLNRARAICSANAQPDEATLATLPYKLFRADAAVWLSNYEEAIDAYRELNRLYPNTVEFSDRLISFTRSFGQHHRRFLEEAASAAHALADAFPVSTDYRTCAGEIQAELGNYDRAKGEWEQLIALGRGEPATYLDTATVYWDYFQYDDALRIIKALRQEMQDQTLYAFQAGAILEAKHQVREALAEYVKALDEETPDYRRARKRLTTLYQRPGVSEQLSLVFEKERRSRNNSSPLVLGYADLLKNVGRWETASALLQQEVARSSSQNFLERARDVFANAQDTAGEQAVLVRLVALARSPRLAISYRLQLAESYHAEGQARAAASVLNDLVRQFPTNYGVLSEAANFYWRMGMRENTLRILQVGMKRGKGRFHYIFARKLAAREIEMNHLPAAERVLRQLHDEDQLDTEVFHELASIYVRTADREALRRIFRETVAAIKEQDLDIKEMRAQLAEFRGRMIKAFTQLKDYRAAIEQHIEIINRDPDDEEKLDAALNYVKRYGGADELLAYYQRTAQEAYKNYRWYLVLARIYEAKGDLASAAQSYRTALVNQPEMLELYDALAGVCARMKDYDAALAALHKATELSNDDPQYVKRLIEVLEKAGRHGEAEVARQKLPPEEPKKQTISDQFSEAARLQRATEKSQAIAAYRQAFNALLANPYKHDLKAADITGYVQTVREEESLDHLMQQLWHLRDQLIREAERQKSTQAGKARTLLAVLDGAIPEAVGSVAAEKATGDELAALFRDLQERIAAATRQEDQHATLALLQNLSRRAGFGSLEEKILIARKDAASSSGEASVYHARLRTLVDFYSERGGYRHIIELLEAERAHDQARSEFEYLHLIAENARLINDREKELQALRDYYRQSSGNISSLQSSANPMVERYFAALYENGEQGRDELRLCAQHPTAYQLQLINFLLAKGERDLAHQAIENAPLPLAWKLARNAEASLALREFDGQNENYFIDALQFKPIGELIGQKPDPSKQLIGNDWFQLAQSYGQWLYLSAQPEQRLKSRALLPAMVENSPQDAGEQARLGQWYLDQREPQLALEHLQLALEAQPGDKRIIAALGSAFFLLGEKDKAEEQWARLISGTPPSLSDCHLYLKTLATHGLSAEARERLFPAIVAHLKEVVDDEYSYYATARKDQEEIKSLIRALAASFNKDEESSGREEPLPPEAEAARESARSENWKAPQGRHSIARGTAPGTRYLPNSKPCKGVRSISPLQGWCGERARFQGQCPWLLNCAPAGLIAHPDDFGFVHAAREAFFRKLCAAVPGHILLPETLIKEALIAKSRFGPFYQILFESSRGFWSYEYDYNYTVLLSNSWSAAEAEEALDHQNNYKVSEIESKRIGWQKEYLNFLIEQRQTAAARKLISSIESEINRRYARPAWLRLANLRLAIRAGQTAHALNGLKHFVGIEVSPSLTKIGPPSTERLNDAVTMLRSEGREAEATQLLEAAYARAIALEQYESPYLIGLARIAFKKADAALGLKLLQLLVDLSRDETANTAAAELASLPWIRAYAVEDTYSERPEPHNDIAQSKALSLAAETASEFAQFDVAIAYRRQLLSISPQDETNRIELARLLAESKRYEEAVNNLAAIIGDRTTTRHARWQAVWLAPEIIEPRPELWSSLRERTQAASPKDNEMAAALDALSLTSTGRSDEAIKLISAIEANNPNPYLKCFHALLAKRNKQDVDALNSFIAALIANRDERVAQAFGMTEDDPLPQLVRLYAAMGQPRAALKLAERINDLKPEGKNETGEAIASEFDGVELDAADQEQPEGSAYETLPARFIARQAKTRIELLGLLSESAERIGDLDQAVAFERAKLNSALTDAEERAAQLRIEQLLALQRENSRKRAPSFNVDRGLVAQR